jgi:hypothetical protein
MTWRTLHYVHLVVEVMLEAWVSFIYTLKVSDTKLQDKFQYCGQGQDSLNFVAELWTKLSLSVIEQTGTQEGQGQNIIVGSLLQNRTDKNFKSI